MRAVEGATEAPAEDAERVVDEHAGDPPPGLKVFGDEPGCAGASGGFDDEGVPERQGVSFLELRGSEDEGNIDLYELPVAVGINKVSCLPS